MNEQNLDPQLQEQYMSLPPVIRKLITESGWQYKIRDIVKANNLQIGQGSVIEDEVFLVMLGFETPEMFLKNIQNETEISYDVARKIEQEVFEKIFAPLKKALVESTLDIEDKENGDLMENTIAQPAPVVPATPEPISIITPQEQTVIEPDPVSLPMQQPAESRDEILSQIENPVKTETQLVKNTQVTVAPVISKPLTAPIAPTQPKPARVDPYREPIV